MIKRKANSNFRNQNVGKVCTLDFTKFFIQYTHIHTDPQTHTHTYTHSLELRILISNTVGHLPKNSKSVINAFKKS